MEESTVVEEVKKLAAHEGKKAITIWVEVPEYQAFAAVALSRGVSVSRLLTDVFRSEVEEYRQLSAPKEVV